MKNENDYIYKCENGKIYGCIAPCCLICKHCSDVFWDYTNGPYMFVCSIDSDESKNECGCDCEKFELIEGAIKVGDYHGI